LSEPALRSASASGRNLARRQPNQRGCGHCKDQNSAHRKSLESVLKVSASWHPQREAHKVNSRCWSHLCHVNAPVLYRFNCIRPLLRIHELMRRSSATPPTSSPHGWRPEGCTLPYHRPQLRLPSPTEQEITSRAIECAIVITARKSATFTFKSSDYPDSKTLHRQPTLGRQITSVMTSDAGRRCNPQLRRQ
jgi:hypothetical protein